ncbi:hypothetical protein BJ138DRAFT_686734 [Hygrophoropsis aurantiaca]|uniref:Uncharacterized protein n=1 Tax=Hygrophoropsis aurantiaca TaxID=72124 RepID=A0ACB8AUN9_9AGAM|nr:hypothetical protein BJ138DRAFT_686734 [Hygrophoropsis aurantiaca]
MAHILGYIDVECVVGYLFIFAPCFNPINYYFLHQTHFTAMNYDVVDTDLENLEAGLHNHEFHTWTSRAYSNGHRGNAHAALRRLKNSFAFSALTVLFQGSSNHELHAPSHHFEMNNTDPTGLKTMLNVRAEDMNNIDPVDGSVPSRINEEKPRRKASVPLGPSASLHIPPESDITPPLTPDSSHGTLHSSSSLATGSIPPYSYQAFDSFLDSNNEDGHRLSMQHFKEIKKGKEPERSCLDALIEDVLPSQEGFNAPSIDDSGDEWCGLEYTLEISRKDLRPSESNAPSIGEYSKSRESWALIHQGAVDPYFEDQEYYRWKRWHRYLEKEEGRRKKKLASAYTDSCDELAWIFTEEVKTRRWIRWQKEHASGSQSVEHAKQHLLFLIECRSDPYYPHDKHNLAWELKRSRSCSTIRNLYPIPSMK